jgi:hypothetical protein
VFFRNLFRSARAWLALVARACLRGVQRFEVSYAAQPFPCGRNSDCRASSSLFPGATRRSASPAAASRSECRAVTRDVRGYDSVITDRRRNGSPPI